MILVQMGLLYMLSALILPDVSDGQSVDLASHFERHRNAFFAFLIAMLASSIVKEVVLEHRLPSPLNLGFHLVLAVIAGAGMFFNDRRVQLGLALQAVAGLFAYIALLFAHL